MASKRCDGVIGDTVRIQDCSTQTRRAHAQHALHVAFWGTYQADLVHRLALVRARLGAAQAALMKAAKADYSRDRRDRSRNRDSSEKSESGA